MSLYFRKASQHEFINVKRHSFNTFTDHRKNKPTPNQSPVIIIVSLHLILISPKTTGMLKKQTHTQTGTCKEARLVRALTEGRKARRNPMRHYRRPSVLRFATHPLIADDS
ncbi:hypothetical protein Hanom_Chr11g00996121 [Helianthus anomalus]